MRRFGGDGGIRTLSGPAESATYRFYVARVAVDASVAVGPCPILRHETTGSLLFLDTWYISRQEKPMALSVKDPEADRLAREVVARTGETLTTAVIVALRERLARLRGRSRRRRLRDELREIAQRCAQLPTLDDRSVEEILGYDERG